MRVKPQGMNSLGVFDMDHGCMIVINRSYNELCIGGDEHVCGSDCCNDEEKADYGPGNGLFVIHLRCPLISK